MEGGRNIHRCSWIVELQSLPCYEVWCPFLYLSHIQARDVERIRKIPWLVCRVTRWDVIRKCIFLKVDVEKRQSLNKKDHPEMRRYFKVTLLKNESLRYNDGHLGIVFWFSRWHHLCVALFIQAITLKNERKQTIVKPSSKQLQRSKHWPFARSSHKARANICRMFAMSFFARSGRRWEGQTDE